MARARLIPHSARAAAPTPRNRVWIVGVSGPGCRCFPGGQHGDAYRCDVSGPLPRSNAVPRKRDHVLSVGTRESRTDPSAPSPLQSRADRKRPKSEGGGKGLRGDICNFRFVITPKVRIRTFWRDHDPGSRPFLVCVLLHDSRTGTSSPSARDEVCARSRLILHSVAQISPRSSADTCCRSAINDRNAEP